MMRRLFVVAILAGLLGGDRLVAQTEQIIAQTNVLAQQQRQGTFTSSSFDVPANPTYKLLFIQLDIPTSDYEDVNNSAKVSIYVFDGSVWRFDSGLGWTGGTVTIRGVVNPPPKLSISLAEFAGRSIRAEVDIPVRMRIGATMNAYQ